MIITGTFLVLVQLALEIFTLDTTESMHDPVATDVTNSHAGPYSLSGDQHIQWHCYQQG